MALDFIHRIGPDDFVAVMPTGRSGSAMQELTRDRRVLSEAIGRFKGRVHPMDQTRSPFAGRDATVEPIPSGTMDSLGMAAPQRGPGPEPRERTLRLLDVIDGVAKSLGHLVDRRKSIILFSQGTGYDLSEALRHHPEDDGIVRNPVDNVDMMVRSAVHQTVTATMRANVAVHAIDPRGVARFGQEGFLSADPDVLADRAKLGQESLVSLAEATGGRAVVRTDDFGGAVEQIIRETSTYYLLGCYPGTSTRERRFRKLEVRVTRPGLTVRARPGYWLDDGRRRQDEGTSPPSPLQDSLTGLVPASELRVVGVALPIRLADPRRSAVVLDLLVHDPSEVPSAPGERVHDRVQVGVVAVDTDADGRERARHGRVQPFVLRRGSQPGPLRFQLIDRVDLEPGRYQIRVGVESERAKKAGSVFLDVFVPDFSRASLSASGLAFAFVSPNPVPTARLDPQSAVLPIVPTAIRVFDRRQRVEVLTRISRGPKSAGPARVRLGVAGEQGDELWQHDGVVSGERLGRPGGYADFRMELPLATLPPGTYVISLDVGEPGASTAAWSTAVPFIVR